MIILGWGGGRPKDHGPAVAQACRSCARSGHLHYFTVTKWLRLYFIPLIPYSTRHFLACPSCTGAQELKTAAERRQVQRLISASRSFAPTARS